MRRLLRAGAALAATLVVAAWSLTSPQALSASDLPDYEPDPARGEIVFWAGGCASCHATPVDGERARGDAKLLLGGGTELDTPYGIFRVPNISPHETDGVGGWSMLDFVNAMQKGVSPAGRHYYPSFPYTSYAKMRTVDVMDLKAYIDTLPAVRVLARQVFLDEVQLQDQQFGQSNIQLKNLSDAPLAACPSCDGKVEKLISQSSFVLKGSGWYKTDYASKSGKSDSAPACAASGSKPSCAGCPSSAD